MAQGRIRTSIEDSNSIPLESPIWFMIVTIQNEKISQEVHQVHIGGSKELLQRLKNLKRNKKEFKCYGVWNGKWNTDLFDMNIEILINRLKEKLKNQ